MAAPKGNQFWNLRCKHGRDKLFAAPELLWEAACDYFQWCDDNPWKAVKTKKKGKSSEKEESVTQRPYTLSGFLSYCGVNAGYWSDFKQSKGFEDFSEIVSRIENVIETQQLEGAIVGAFNPNIIARKLGLAEKQDNTIKLKGSVPIIEFLKNGGVR